MANHKSAVKRHKQSLKRAARNKAIRSRIRNAVKDVRAAVQAKDKEQAEQNLRQAAVIIDKAAGKGTLHWKNAARKLSRLARSVNAVNAA